MNRVTTRLPFVVGVCLVFVPDAFAELTPRPKANPALPIEIAEDVAIDLVETLFLFDRLFTKSATVTSLDYLERVSEPSSKFYPDYLEYKEGQISQAELVARLPHIAMIGDSLCKNAYISSVPSMFWRARTARRKNWFLDTDPSPKSIYSVYERLEKFTPLVGTEYSTAGAEVDSGDGKESLLLSLVRACTFSQQVNQILLSKRYPDLIMIYMGGNNLNWAAGLSLGDREHPEKHLHEDAMRFREDYARQVRRLIARAKGENHRVSIVVFGLLNYGSFFKTREIAEALKARNPKLYPYLETSASRFVSLKPAYRGNTIRLALMMNKELQLMVTDFNNTLKHSPNVQVRYLDAFAKVNINRVEWIHAMDASHPSREGHSVLAETAFNSLVPSLHFLGIESQVDISSRSQLGH
jgi:lysophospholipase L1-like esterase